MGSIDPRVSDQVRKYVEELRRILPDIEEVILFGSQARGGATPASDIDLAVVSPTFRGMDVLSRALLLGEANARLFYPIEAVGLTPNEVARASRGTMIAEIVRTGQRFPF